MQFGVGFGQGLQRRNALPWDQRYPIAQNPLRGGWFLMAQYLEKNEELEFVGS